MLYIYIFCSMTPRVQLKMKEFGICNVNSTTILIAYKSIDYTNIKVPMGYKRWDFWMECLDAQRETSKYVTYEAFKTQLQKTCKFAFPITLCMLSLETKYLVKTASENLTKLLLQIQNVFQHNLREAFLIRLD